MMMAGRDQEPPPGLNLLARYRPRLIVDGRGSRRGGNQATNMGWKFITPDEDGDIFKVGCIIV
jgi:hypothetical protein